MTNSILIVDDLQFMRSLLTEILLQEGYTVAGEAVNGEEAVRLFGELSPDLVLMDITMPVMDGIRALEEIKRLDSAARVVMCTALGQQKMILRAIGLGATDYIVKPFSRERILNAVNKALQRTI